MAKHMVVYMLGRIVPAIIALLSVSVFTRILALEQYGYFALVTSIALTLDGFFGQWLMAAIMRFQAGQEDEVGVDRLLACCGLLFLIPALLGCALGAMVLFTCWQPGSERTILLLALPYFFIYSFAQLSLRVHMARLDSCRFTILQLTQTAVSTSAAIGLVACVSPEPALAVLGVISGFALIICLDWRTTAKLLALMRVRRGAMLDIIRFAWPTILASGFAVLTSRLNRVFVLVSLGPMAIGILNASQALSEQALASVFMMIAMVSQPLTVRLLEQASTEALEWRLRRTATWVFGLGLPSAIGFALLAPELVAVFLGAEYRSMAVEIIPWIAASAFLNGLRTHFVVHSFFLAHKMHYNLYVAAPVLFVMLTSNCVLIPIFGLFGAVSSILITEIFATILSSALTRWAFPLPLPWLEIGRIVVAVLLMAGCMNLLPPGPAIQMLSVKLIVAVGIYISACVALNIDGSRRKIACLARNRIAASS